MISNPMNSFGASRGANLLKVRFFRDTLYKKKKIAKYRRTLLPEIQFMPLIFESTGLLESEAHKKLKLLVEQNNGGNLL